MFKGYINFSSVFHINRKKAQLFECYPKSAFWFFQVRKRKYSEKQRTHLPKRHEFLNFVEKNCCMQFKKMCRRVVGKCLKNLWPTVGFQPATSLLPIGGATPMYCESCQRFCRRYCASRAISGKGEELRLLNWLFPFRKVYWRKWVIAAWNFATPVSLFFQQKQNNFNPPQVLLESSAQNICKRNHQLTACVFLRVITKNTIARIRANSFIIANL